ncbi:MAG: thiamine phosphate synthase [Oscillospiraceae bacterium]|nr:thiamine phosphate synthase [Oscillospiraceae bacterium]
MYNKLICISNRSLCSGNFIERIRDILDMGIPVILREKDLTEAEYYDMLVNIDRKEIIAHTFIDASKAYGCLKIHLPLPLLETADVSGFEVVGSSTHSIEQACRAEKLGASYITAGHVFETDCKKGLAPRGTELLAEINKTVSIPVYALGGISSDNAAAAISAGAYGAAVMSGFMKCDDPREYRDRYKHIL